MLQLGMKRESNFSRHVVNKLCVFLTPSGRCMECMSNCYTGYMDLLGLIAITGANVSCLFAVTWVLCLLSQLSFYM
jgi:hypothetical protein